LIARAEQCGFGLSRKLESRGYPGSCVRAVIAHLEDLDILSDERFALSWLRSRLGNSVSPRNLLAALHRRGVDRSAARQALDAALEPEAELALLRRYLRKRGLAQDRYLRSTLKYEGFSPAVIQTFLDEMP
jgi:regulatory protein